MWRLVFLLLQFLKMSCSLHPLLMLQHPLCSSEKSYWLIRWSYMAPDCDKIPVIGLLILGRHVIGLKFPGCITLLGSLMIRWTFPVVIHTGTEAVEMYSFIWAAILKCAEERYFSQYLCSHPILVRTSWLFSSLLTGLVHCLCLRYYVPYFCY